MSDHQAATPVSSLSLFSKSKEIIVKNPKTYAVVFLLPFLMGFASNAHSLNGNVNRVPRFGYNLSPTLFGFGVLFTLLSVFVYFIVMTMQFALNLGSANGKEPSLDDLWPVVKKFGVRIICLMIVLGLVIGIGLIAFIVPGIIFIRRYYLAPYVMIDKDLSIGESMSQSAKLTKPYAMSVWGLVGVTILLSIPSIIPVFGWAISFVLTTLYAVAPALRYVELKKLSSN